jgi:protease-4
MKRTLVVLLCLIGGMTLLMIGAGVVIGFAKFSMKPGLPSKILLEVDLETGMLEDIPDDPIASLMQRDTPTVRDYISALRAAQDDSRVTGLVARIGAGGFGMAITQELRDAIVSFREAGKFAIAYSETFGEVGPGNGGYYLATGFDEIWLQPSGDVGLTGLIYESPFVRGTLDKVGITARMDHRYEYKNAMNFYTDTAFTPAHREALDRIAQSQFEQIVRGVATARKLSETEVRARVDRGPFLGAEAVEAGLVDGLAYRDEVYAKARERAGEKASLLYLLRYGERAPKPHAKQTIALIYGVGAVMRGESGYNAVTGEMTMGSDTVAGAIRDAVADDSVKAILFRVDSPGGSYAASDTIWRETIRAKEAGKPVIVSMGNLAGSGGYFVAMGASKIVAQPGTITGSIGVLGGKFLTKGMWDKIGLTWDEVHTSENATMWTGVHDYSPAEYERFQRWLDRVYADFTAKVAEGRHLPIEKVREIAKGRIWTGEDALPIGLVDELGGFRVAVRLAKEAAGIGPDDAVLLKRYPARKSPYQSFFGQSPENSDPAAAAEAVRRTLIALQPAARALAPIVAGADRYGVLSMTPIEPTP